MSADGVSIKREPVIIEAAVNENSGGVSIKRDPVSTIGEKAGLITDETCVIQVKQKSSYIKEEEIGFNEQEPVDAYQKFMYYHKKMSKSLSRASYAEEGGDFLPWIRAKAGEDICKALEMRKSCNGRGLYATKYIEKGDVILKIPWSAQLSPDKLPRSLMGDDGIANNLIKLALVILHQKMLGPNSEWEPYLNHLPSPQDMHSTIFWSDQQLRMILPSFLYQETLTLKTIIRDYFLKLKPLLSESTLEDFTHAYGFVKSRAFSTNKGVPSLIPFLDFLNHDDTSKARVWNDVSQRCTQVIADRDYAIGEEIMITYGKNLSNAMLLLNHGFMVYPNPHDFVVMWVSMQDQKDRLYNLKTTILRNQQRVDDENEWNPTNLTNHFKIYNVEAGCKEGKGIPILLRAYARIEVCNSEIQLNALHNHNARHPLKNTRMEIEAHELLRDQLSEMIHERISHFTFKLPCVFELDETSAKRRRIALNLREVEIGVLKSVVAWLDYYCAMLGKRKHSSCVDSILYKKMS